MRCDCGSPECPDSEPSANKARAHKIISYAKSGTRFIGYVLLFVSIPAAAVTLILSELAGVAEKIWGA